MEYFWINKKDKNKKIIVFFNGWGMNETPIKHLKCGDFDILEVFDYRNLDFDFDRFNFNKYTEKYLIAWSMGVYSASRFKNIFNDFNKKIAINGTMKVIDDDYGIPPKIYTITAKLLNRENMDKFIKNMFNNGQINPNITISRSLADLKEELIAIQNIKLTEYLNFDKVIISKDDRIIPTKNQLNFWQNKAQTTDIIQINSTHCPFEIYSFWVELLC